ncbi:MAG: hypothetical protein IPM69_10810 [Ignavibacteria bacterium]|nr:hypothetical protein [Ignavibacteria bacterium]
MSVVTSKPTKDLIVEALPTQLIDTENIQPVTLPLYENLPLENIAKQAVKANIAGVNSINVVPPPSTNSQPNTKITGTEFPEDLTIEVKALTGKSDEIPKLVQVKNYTESSSIPAPIKGEKFVENVLTEPIFAENSSTKHTQIPSVKNSTIHEGSDSITYENGKNISRDVSQKSTTVPKASPSEIVVETLPIEMKDSSDDISVSSLQSKDTQFSVDR